MFDCRMDVGALFYQFDVTVRHVVDLQIAAVQRLLRPGAPFLIGMHKTFNDKLMLFTAADAKSKDAGRFLFAPEKGGQYEAWFARPMAAALQDYCAVDVKYFFAAAQKLAPSDLALRNCATLSLKRVTRVTTERVENCSAERDF
uniref:Uncharacterized protein n=1 Tax=Neobodo designis TaxID=312471 RepID=A0A7S1LEU0_NEODS|mmetsp:Transcript_20398/g.63397  ORF Transcript_20398/g.63397 Transcript_20398/m.63397 type:complete len:144 (+) Transcript_20398:350-781(+)